MVGARQKMARKRGMQRWVQAYGLALLAAGPARADTEAIRVEYRGEAGCPSSEQFVAQLLRRTSKVRLATASEPARTFMVVIERDATGYSGSLTIREHGGETFARKVAGRECAAVADALVLSTALAVDPTSVEPPAPDTPPAPPEQPEPRPPTGSTTAGESGRESAKPVPAPEPEDQARLEPEPDEDVEVVVVEQEPAHEIPIPPPIWRERWSLAISLGPELRLENAPRDAFGGTLSVAAYPPDTARPLASIGMALTLLQSLEESIDGAAAAFRFLLARPFVCALLVRPAQYFEVMPCLATELGSVTGEGSGLPNPSTEHRFWFALGAELRLETTIADRVILGAGGGAVFPLTRYRFEFEDPQTRIYEVPSVGFSASARLGLRF
jgi:hypothetical protein